MKNFSKLISARALRIVVFKSTNNDAPMGLKIGLYGCVQDTSSVKSGKQYYSYAYFSLFAPYTRHIHAGILLNLKFSFLRFTTAQLKNIK